MLRGYPRRALLSDRELFDLCALRGTLSFNLFCSLNEDITSAFECPRGALRPDDRWGVDIGGRFSNEAFANFCHLASLRGKFSEAEWLAKHVIAVRDYVRSQVEASIRATR